MRISLMLLAALAAATPALGQVLTLDEARRRALESQPALRALELSARAAKESAVADAAMPDPRLKLGALNFPMRGFPGAPDDMTQVGVSWEQVFPSGDKRRLRSERTLAEAEQARAEADTALAREACKPDRSVELGTTFQGAGHAQGRRNCSNCHRDHC